MKYDVSMLEIKLLLMTVQLGNFSEVARRQTMTPSSVSRKMAQLERKLGTKLLHRHTRSISLTAEGLAFTTQCHDMLRHFEQVTEGIEQRADTPRGTVKLSVPVAFGRLHIAPYLSELLTRYPLLNVELEQTDSFVDPAAEGVDLLFRIGVMQDSRLRMKTLAPQRYIMAASPDYLQRHGEPTTPSQLANHNCLVFKGVKGLQRWFIGHDLLQPYEVTGNLYCNNAETLVTAATDGAGIVLFPSWLIGEAIRVGQLLPLLTDYQLSTTNEQQQICALYLDTDKLSPKVRVVIDFFVEKFGSPCYWDVQ